MTDQTKRIPIERYETPEMEIVEFETEDIITDSTNDLPGMPIGLDNMGN